MGADDIELIRRRGAARHGGDGRTLDIAGCQLMEVTDGRICRVRGHYCDEEALDSFWRAP